METPIAVPAPNMMTPASPTCRFNPGVVLFCAMAKSLSLARKA
jgi:hypothetical protein